MAQTIRIGDVFPLDDYKIGNTNGHDWMYAKVPNAEGGKGTMMVFIDNVDDVKDQGWKSAKIVDMWVKKSNRKVDEKWQESFSITVKIEKVDADTRQGFMNIPEGADEGLPFA